MDKRELILNAMQKLLAKKKSANCSVSDIARDANIAKGGLYYYFKSKEDVFDALVERTYVKIIEKCEAAIKAGQDNALAKLRLLFQIYTISMADRSVDEYLHQPQNALIHQKPLQKYSRRLPVFLHRLLAKALSKGCLRVTIPKNLHR